MSDVKFPVWDPRDEDFEIENYNNTYKNRKGKTNYLQDV